MAIPFEHLGKLEPLIESATATPEEQGQIEHMRRRRAELQRIYVQACRMTWDHFKALQSTNPEGYETMVGNMNRWVRDQLKREGLR